MRRGFSTFCGTWVHGINLSISSQFGRWQSRWACHKAFTKMCLKLSISVVNGNALWRDNSLAGCADGGCRRFIFLRVSVIVCSQSRLFGGNHWSWSRRSWLCFSPSPDFIPVCWHRFHFFVMHVTKQWLVVVISIHFTGSGNTDMPTK